MANPYKGPRAPVPRTPSGQQVTSEVPEVQASLSYDAFMQAIEAHGVRVVHYRAIPDPRGMASRGDNHGVQSERDSEDQFIYKEAGTCEVLLTNNQTNVSVEALGEINFSTAYMTLPQEYEGCDKPVIVHQWDRFFLKDIEIRVVNMQFVENHASGVDRLQYPATCVEALIDADGIEYTEGKDFEITTEAGEEGNIRWLGQSRPTRDPGLSKGKVYSIRYRYTPFFIVSRLVHEIRVAKITDMATYERSVKRMPYQVEVIRERVYKDRNRSEEVVQDDPRFTDAPPTGGMLGPK